MDEYELIMDKQSAWDVHLTTTENQTLLGRWYTRLLLDFLLYPCDLSENKSIDERRMAMVISTLSSGSMSSSI
jgi:hypothetical protein